MEKSKKLSLTHCKGILESTGKRYTDQQVEEIRDILYQLAEMDYLIRKDLPNRDENDEIKAA